MLTFSQLGRYGRFANQLFQIAGTIGLAIHHGYAYAFPEWVNHDHKERFGSTEDIGLQKYFVHRLPRTDTQFRDFPIDWGFHPRLFDSLPDNVSLSGHMQSEKYFAHCKIVIQQAFTMKDEPIQSNNVAMHWRLGDYDDHYHPRLTIDYYRQALKELGGNDPVIVFSDDHDRAMQLGVILSEETGREIDIAMADYISDFRLMKTCKHFICGNSSYSLMAAILGRHPDKKIVCPRTWFGKAWVTPLETKDLYPENSIVL